MSVNVKKYDSQWSIIVQNDHRLDGGREMEEFLIIKHLRQHLRQHPARTHSRKGLVVVPQVQDDSASYQTESQ